MKIRGNEQKSKSKGIVSSSAHKIIHPKKIVRKLNLDFHFSFDAKKDSTIYQNNEPQFYADDPMLQKILSSICELSSDEEGEEVPAPAAVPVKRCPPAAVSAALPLTPHSLPSALSIFGWNESSDFFSKHIHGFDV